MKSQFARVLGLVAESQASSRRERSNLVVRASALALHATKGLKPLLQSVYGIY